MPAEGSECPPAPCGYVPAVFPPHPLAPGAARAATQALAPAALLTHPAGADLAMDVDFRLDRASYGVGGGSWADTSVVSGEIPVHVHLLVAR